MSNDAGQESKGVSDPTEEPTPKRRFSRRGLLRAGAATGLSAATAATVLLPGAPGKDVSADVATIPIADVQLPINPQAAMSGNTLAGYTFFNPLMVDVVTAAAERLIPKDDNGPGATDAGVVYFIDRQLSSEYGMVGKRYEQGPFAAGAPTQGDQIGLTMRERYRLGVDGMQAYAHKVYQKDFKTLAPGEQDRILKDMESGAATEFTGISGQQFFQLLLGHVKAGFFADPIYGGNRDLMGWKMIGYPGAQVVYADWISRYGEKFTGPYLSLVDHQEHQHWKDPPMATLPKVDVVFVGFGMVGGIIANELSKRATNLKMVGLERGPFRDTYPDFVVDHHDEWKYAVQGQLFQDYAKETSTFRNNGTQTALPIRQLGNFLPGNGVGGAQVHWNGVTWRFLPDFFVYRSHLEQRYGKSFLPPDTTIQDWGITYDELEPYYTQFDKTMGISGKAGNLKGQIQDGGNPFEGPRSEEYPQAPYQVAYGPSLFQQAAKDLGYKPFVQPSANSPGNYTNPDGMTLGACNYCGHCERFGCHVGAKASPLVTVIPNALKSGRVEVRPFSNVFRINQTGGRATSVSYYDQNGIEQEQPADLVVVATFTLNNIRLLLLSKIGQAYDPQANTGVVGRNFTHQLGGAGASGWYEDRTLNRFMGSGANGVCMDEFNGDNFDHKDLGFFGGGNISCSDSGARPIQSTGSLPPGSPTWGSGWKSAVSKYYDRFISIGMQGEHAAYRQNYVDLDPTYRDNHGNPLVRITLDWTDNERKQVDWVNKNVMPKIIGQMGPAIKQVNGPITNYSSVPYQSTHINGGTVMGSDPSTSVVNKYCQVWGMPNLFVIGASNFPQNGGYNPTGTVGALAYHAVDAIVTKYLPSPGMLT